MSLLDTDLMETELANFPTMFTKEHLISPFVTRQFRMTDREVVQAVARTVGVLTWSMELKGVGSGHTFGGVAKVVPAAKEVARVATPEKIKNKLKFF